MHVATRHSEGTTESQQLHRAQHTVTTLSFRGRGHVLEDSGHVCWRERIVTLCSTHKVCRADPCMSCWRPILPQVTAAHRATSSSRRVARKAIEAHARAFTVAIGTPNCTTAFNQRSIVYYLQTTSVLTLYLLTTSTRALHSAAVFATHA